MKSMLVQTISEQALQESTQAAIKDGSYGGQPQDRRPRFINDTAFPVEID